jgi:hypothetical protein
VRRTFFLGLGAGDSRLESPDQRVDGDRTALCSALL